jgi:hypothetical protein
VLTAIVAVVALYLLVCNWRLIAIVAIVAYALSS